MLWSRWLDIIRADEVDSKARWCSLPRIDTSEVRSRSRQPPRLKDQPYDRTPSWYNRVSRISTPILIFTTTMCLPAVTPRYHRQRNVSSFLYSGCIHFAQFTIQSLLTLLLDTLSSHIHVPTLTHSSIPIFPLPFPHQFSNSYSDPSLNESIAPTNDSDWPYARCYLTASYMQAFAYDYAFWCSSKLHLVKWNSGQWFGYSWRLPWELEMLKSW